jgi:hypothetical protein
MGASEFESLPRRLFVDSSTLQVMQTYGEFIYDGGEVSAEARIRTMPDGLENLEALRRIMLVGQRAPFELVLSENSLLEVRARGRIDYLHWAHEVLAYWQDLLSRYALEGIPPFSGRGQTDAQRIMANQFGYLGAKDRALLRDALLLECDAFITMDAKLASNADHIERATGLRLLEPRQYWDLLEPWSALFV